MADEEGTIESPVTGETAPEDLKPTYVKGQGFSMVTPAMRKAAADEQQTPPEGAKRRSLAEYIKEYPYNKRPHPWARLLRAIPMGVTGEVPMNHEQRVLNLIAIHLERLGFPEPVMENREIKYIPPQSGPNVAYNPGTWVDIDADVPTVEDQEEISLAGVPPEQLAVLRKAVEDEERRIARIGEADPAAREEAQATVATHDVQVVAKEKGEDQA